MIDLSSLLPTTALVAVVIFIAKETTEAVRRWKGDKRRKAAYCELLARECELNNWAMRSLKRIAADLQSELSEGGSHEVLSIEYAASGRTYVRIQSSNGSYGKSALPKVHNEVMNRHLVDIATLDKELFQLVDAALTASAELEHVREGLLYHGSTDDAEAKTHVAGFSEYAIETIDESNIAIAALYEACTGRPLKEFRLR